jgi:dihydroneopterin aldolase
VSIPSGLDRIDLSGIAAHGYHGVFDDEKKNGQTFVVDVSLGLDLGPAARMI